MRSRIQHALKYSASLEQRNSQFFIPPAKAQRTCPNFMKNRKYCHFRSTEIGNIRGPKVFVKSPNKLKDQHPLAIRAPITPNAHRDWAILEILNKKVRGFTITPIPNLSNSVNTTAFMNTYQIAIVVKLPEYSSGFKAVSINQCRHEDKSRYRTWSRLRVNSKVEN